MLLAVLSFVVSFWAPLFIKIVGLVFGFMNLLIIGSWFSAFVQGLVQAKKAKKMEDK